MVAQCDQVAPRVPKLEADDAQSLPNIPKSMSKKQFKNRTLFEAIMLTHEGRWDLGGPKNNKTAIISQKTLIDIIKTPKPLQNDPCNPHTIYSTWEAWV